jgi:hypothetical protein
MIQSTSGELQARSDVVRLQIRQLLDHLVGSQAGREQIEHVRHPNPHPSDAGAPSALGGIDGDALD